MQRDGELTSPDSSGDEGEQYQPQVSRHRAYFNGLFQGTTSMAREGEGAGADRNAGPRVNPPPPPPPPPQPHQARNEDNAPEQTEEARAEAELLAQQAAEIEAQVRRDQMRQEAERRNQRPPRRNRQTPTDPGQSSRGGDQMRRPIEDLTARRRTEATQVAAAARAREQHEATNDLLRRGYVYNAASGAALANPTNPTLLQLMNDEGFVTAMQARFEDRSRLNQALEGNNTLTDEELEIEAMKSILLDSLNGQRILPEQTAEVEYMRKNQHLLLPYALGMRVNKRTQRVIWVDDQDDLQLRYKQLSTFSYGQLADIVRSNAGTPAIRQAITSVAVDPNAPLVRMDAWDDPAWYVVNAEGIGANANAVFALISQALQFNCDVRDTGYLFLPDSTVSDVAWKDYKDTPPERLRDHLRPHTKLCIAAMNTEPCAGSELGGWIRAYGVGLGVLPTADSFCEREITFDARQPSRDRMRAASNFKRDFPSDLLSMSANTLAMFGLFHLNKDHTYKTNDQNMLRIGISYMGTLRTGITDAVYKSLDRIQEVIVRTAPHPFGLAQTYWLSQAMFKYGMLTSPLAKRVDTTPPPVQRLNIMLTAIGEWAGVPKGKELINLYAEEVEIMGDERAVVAASPPSYSDLHKCYGVPVKAVLSEEAVYAISSVTPCVHGYVTVVHCSSDAKKDGLGYALSLENMEREAKGQVASWKSAWQNHLDGLDGLSIVDYATANLAANRDGRRRRR